MIKDKNCSAEIYDKTVDECQDIDHWGSKIKFLHGIRNLIDNNFGKPRSCEPNLVP